MNARVPRGQTVILTGSARCKLTSFRVAEQHYALLKKKRSLPGPQSKSKRVSLRGPKFREPQRLLVCRLNEDATGPELTGRFADSTAGAGTAKTSALLPPAGGSSPSGMSVGMRHAILTSNGATASVTVGGTA